MVSNDELPCRAMKMVRAGTALETSHDSPLLVWSGLGDAPGHCLAKLGSHRQMPGCWRAAASQAGASTQHKLKGSSGLDSARPIE